MRRIGFIQDEAAEPALSEVGYAEAGAAEEADDEGSWFGWALKIFMDFCMVYGLLAFIQNLINYLRAW